MNLSSENPNLLVQTAQATTVVETPRTPESASFLSSGNTNLLTENPKLLVQTAQSTTVIEDPEVDDEAEAEANNSRMSSVFKKKAACWGVFVFSVCMAVLVLGDVLLEVLSHTICIQLTVAGFFRHFWTMGSPMCANIAYIQETLRYVYA